MCSDHGRRALVKQASLLRRAEMRDAQVVEFRSLFNPFLERELEVVRSALEDGRDLNDVVDEFYPSHQERLVEQARPVVEDYGSRIVEAALEEMEESVTGVDGSGFVTPYTEGLAARWTSNSIGQLRQIEQAEEDTQEIAEERMEEWEGSRTQFEAEREATQANGGFAKHAFLLAGAPILVWRAVGDSCPLCSAKDGQRVSITDAFMNPGDELEAGEGEGMRRLVAQSRIGHPPLHGMGGKGGVCDCLVTVG